MLVVFNSTRSSRWRLLDGALNAYSVGTGLTDSLGLYLAWSLWQKKGLACWRRCKGV